jgi:ABC-type sugar transport system substrate-binding protein
MTIRMRALGALALALAIGLAADAHAQAKKPNILVIMGDDIGWFNPSI